MASQAKVKRSEDLSILSMSDPTKASWAFSGDTTFLKGLAVGKNGLPQIRPDGSQVLCLVENIIQEDSSKHPDEVIL